MIKENMPMPKNEEEKIKFYVEQFADLDLKELQDLKSDFLAKKAAIENELKILTELKEGRDAEVEQEYEEKKNDIENQIKACDELIKNKINDERVVEQTEISGITSALREKEKVGPDKKTANDFWGEFNNKHKEVQEAIRSVADFLVKNKPEMLSAIEKNIFDLFEKLKETETRFKRAISTYEKGMSFSEEGELREILSSFDSLKTKIEETKKKY